MNLSSLRCCLPDQLLHRWWRVGNARGLTTDEEIATFLLNRYQKDQDKSEPPAVCSQCNAPLTLCCVKCQLLSQPTQDSLLHLTGSLSSKHMVRCDQDLSGESVSQYSICHNINREHNIFDVHVDEKETDDSHDVDNAGIKSVVEKSDTALEREYDSAACKPLTVVKVKRLVSLSRVQARCQTRKTTQTLTKQNVGCIKEKSSVTDHQTQPSDDNTDSEKLSSKEDQFHSASMEENSAAAVCQTPLGDVCGKSKLHVITQTHTWSASFVGIKIPTSKIKTGSAVSGKSKVACSVCSVEVTKKYLKYHMKIHGDRQSFICDVCGSVFKQWGNLRTHRRIHTGEKPHKCDQCDASFRLRTQLQDHVSRHTGIYSHVCELCGFGCNLPNRLKKHLRTHTGEKPFTCDDCGWKFTQLNMLKTHWQAKHSGQTPFKCSKCDSAYSNKHALSVHRRKHLHKMLHPPEKNCICEICGHASTNVSSLKSHKLTHSDDRPFTCKRCSVSYKTQAIFARHMKICGEEKQYQCEFCNSKFTTKSFLKDHTKIHTGQDRYTCDVCGAQFNFRNGLKVHRRKHTGEKPYSCVECGARFAAISYLYTHRLTHSDQKPFACTLCDARFVRANGLKNHMVVHSEIKAYVCNICGGRYPRPHYLKVHMRLKHTGDKPYHCNQCDSAFALTRDLKKHTQRVHVATE